MADVSVSVMDFAEDIAEPIVPILEALGMIGGDGDDLDLEGWDLEKALGFIASYQRTSSLLTVLDLLDPDLIPTPFAMYRDGDGHVTVDSSTDSIEETWYPLVDFTHTGKNVQFGITLHREQKSEFLEDGTNCQIMFIGIFGKVSDISVGGSSLLNVDLSFPLLRLESFADGSVTKKILMIQDAEVGEENRSSLSIQAQLRPDPSTFGSGVPVVLGDSAGVHCDAIILRLAIGRDAGVDLELNLDNFVGSASAAPQDLDLSLMQAGQGFNPDYSQLLDILLSSVSSGSLSEHLLPILGLDSSKAPSVPEIGIIDLLMNMDGASDLVNGIKDWALGILTNSTDFESWIRHFVALFTGADPGSSYLPGDGTEASPWRVPFTFASGNGEIGIRLWTTNGSDGSFWVDLGLDANFTMGFNPSTGATPLDQNHIALGLELDVVSFPLIGSGSVRTLSSGFLGLEVGAADGRLFEWTAGSGNFSPALNSAIGNFDGHVGSFRAGLSLGPNRTLAPDICLVDVVIGAAPSRDIDLLSGGLLDELLNTLGDPFRDAISDLLVNDPYMQRIGALLGLVCPRNNGTSHDVRSTMWEGSTDLRIGGSNSTIGFLDLIQDPMSTIGRYHRNLLETPSLPNASGDLVGVRPWSLMIEAIMDIVHSFASEIRGDLPIPIRTDGPCDVLVTNPDSDTDTYTVEITPSDTIPKVELEVDFKKSGSDHGHLSIHPVIGFSDVSLGKSLVFDAGLIVDLFSIVLPNPVVQDSVSSDVVWLEGARLDVTIQSPMIGVSRPSIEILSLASMEMTLQSISAGVEWIAPTPTTPSQFGYYCDVKDFNFGGAFPDLSGFFSSLSAGFDLSGIDGLSWDGIDLHFPDLSFIRFHGSDRGWWNFDGTERFNWGSISWPITIPGVSISLPSLSLGSFSGWTIPDMNLRSLDGFDFNIILRILFPSLPDLSGGGSWDLAAFLTLPEIRSLIGKFLSLRCGRLGLFLAGFFKIDPHFGMFDLGPLLRGNGFEMPTFNLPDLPDAWRISLGLNSNSFGMGPFSLPLDWPEIDWTSFDINNPWPSIKQFFLDLFNGCSVSGEPFALPALRWLWGLLSGKLPDLRLPDFGWGGSSRSGSGWSGFDWGGFDWGGLTWPNLNWGDFNWGNLNWGDLDWGSLDLTGVDWNNLDWSCLDWSNLNWDGLNWSNLNWGSLNWNKLDWGSLNWGGLNWGSLDWGSLNPGNSNWTGFNWSSLNWGSMDWSGLDWAGLDWSFFDWGSFIGGFSGFNIKLPSIPLTITGTGIYDDPWAVGLQKEGLPKVELLFWLDPDGLPRVDGIPEVFNHLGAEVMDILESVLAVDSPSLPTDWAPALTQMLSQLASLDPKAAHAIGNMLPPQITSSLIGFEAFMRASDGLIGIASQQDWGSTTQTSTHEAHHLNVLRTSSIISEAVAFLNTVAGSTPWKVLFVSPSWMSTSAWDDMVTGFVTVHSGPSNLEVTDLSAAGVLTPAQIEITDLSGHDATARFHLLVPTLAIPTSGTYSDHLENQVSVMVDHLTSSSGSKVFLIGHSVGGLAVRYYSEGGPDTGSNGVVSNRDTKIMGALTVSTPHGSDSLRSTSTGEAVLQVMQLLRLIGSIDPSNPPTFNPSSFSEIVANAEGEKNLTPDIIEQLSQILLEAGMQTGNPGAAP